MTDEEAKRLTLHVANSLGGGFIVKFIFAMLLTGITVHSGPYRFNTHAMEGGEFSAVLLILFGWYQVITWALRKYREGNHAP